MHAHYSFSPDEIDDAVVVLELAVRNHRTWYSHLLEGLLCGEPFKADITDLQAHTKCAFGEWYYHNVSDALQSVPEFATIETVHKAMHDTARQVVLGFHKGKGVALEDYRFLSAKQDELVRLLEGLRHSIVSQQHSFDSLTGLVNRKSVGLVLEKSHAYAIRHHEPYTLAMLDIDFFKAVNDNYGHLAGDAALRAVAHCMLTSVRESDSVGRYGGEEFLILMPGTRAEMAANILERLRKSISKLDIEYDDAVINLTISIGFSVFSPGSAVWEVVKEADQALYRAKKTGRNRVVKYQDESGTV